MKLSLFFIFFCLTFSSASIAASQIGAVSVTNVQCKNVTLSIGLNSSWKEAPHANKPTYIVSKVIPNDFLVIATSNSPNIVIPLNENSTTALIIEARSKRRSGVSIKMYRVVAQTTVGTPACAPYVPLTGEVRIRHENTGKCMFGDPNDGGTVKTFTCWNDPNMSYLLDPVATNEVRLRHKNTGKCAYSSTPHGMRVRNWVCWNDPAMTYILDPLPGTNRYRIRSKSLNQCIYGDPGEAMPVKGWAPCWNDPGMVWVLDYL